MKNSDFHRIQHIKGYCEEIAETIRRFGASQEIFMSDIDYFKSVSMSIMQIGELSTGISEEFKDATKNQMQWGLIRGMRNMFAHTYAKMDKKIIWEVAANDIPGLLLFCEKVVEQHQNNLHSPSTVDNNPGLQKSSFS